jgi:hypothetical protein
VTRIGRPRVRQAPAVATATRAQRSSACALGQLPAR